MSVGHAASGPVVIALTSAISIAHLPYQLSKSACHAGFGCTLHMPDADEHSMGSLLEWVCRGLEAIPSLSAAELLFEAANKYNLPELQFRCADCICWLLQTAA